MFHSCDEWVIYMEEYIKFWNAEKVSFKKSSDWFSGFVSNGGLLFFSTD